MFCSPSSTLYSGDVGDTAMRALLLLGDGVLGAFVGKVNENSAFAKADFTPWKVSCLSDKSSTLLALDNDGLGFAPNENKLFVLRPVGTQLLESCC